MVLVVLVVMSWRRFRLCCGSEKNKELEQATRSLQFEAGAKDNIRMFLSEEQQKVAREIKMLRAQLEHAQTNQMTMFSRFLSGSQSRLYMQFLQSLTPRRTTAQVRK